MTTAIFFPGLLPSKHRTVEGFLTHSRYAAARFAEASSVLGYSLDGAYRSAEVYDWEIFEASFLALNLALADHAEHDFGVVPALCGGQSFGAVIAAVFAGSLSYEDALLLTRRSVLVESDYFGALAEPVGCHFFYRLSEPVIERLLEEVRDGGDWIEVSVALDESVCAVSAPLRVLEAFERRVREEKGVPFYTMNRAEHCEAVRPLRDRLEHEVYRGLRWSAPRVPMVSDVDGSRLLDGPSVMHDLLEGWVTPVEWRVTAYGLAEAGTTEVYVVGPRNLFGRMTSRAYPTRLVTPQDVTAGRHPRLIDPPRVATPVGRRTS